MGKFREGMKENKIANRKTKERKSKCLWMTDMNVKANGDDYNMFNNW